MIETAVRTQWLQFCNRGSVFKLYLPMATALVKNSVEPIPTTRGSDFTMQVLLIDDDRDAREAMQILLQTWGCRCDAAASIEDALVLAKAAGPQLRISDYRLRGSTTGIDAIAAIRAVSGQDLAALLISGDTSPYHLHDAETSGISLLHKTAAIG